MFCELQVAVDSESMLLLLLWCFVADLTKNTAENRLPSATSGAGQRSSVTSPICVIFIHPLQNGLCRVKLQAHQSRYYDTLY